VQRLFKEKRIWISVTTILVVVLLFFLVPPLSAGVKNLSLKIISIPANVFTGMGRHFRSKGDLEKENRLLRKEVGELSLRLGQFEELRNENKRLRALLQFKDSVGFDTVSAEVIARNPSDWESTFVINKGSSDGLRKNMAVCSSKGLLGKTLEVQSGASSVMLVAHPGFKAGGTLKDARINGVIVGTGRGLVKMLYIPVDAEVKKGEIVVTSGFSQIFPKGITVGEVVSVDKSKTGLYKYALVKPSADPSIQEEVLCIK
jgi:rod shape-determining protein MreC